MKRNVAVDLNGKPMNDLSSQRRSPREVRVFQWATGQDDNIGDSLLRRPSIADARGRGSSLHLFHGRSTPTFDTGLGLVSEDVLYKDIKPWILAAFRSGFVRRTLIVPNAGEVKVSRRGSIRLFMLWAASLAPKSRVIWMGAGVPGERNVWSIPYRLLARRAKVAAFRDAESVQLLRTGRVAPDWAFALGTSTDDWPSLNARNRIAIILRGDREEPSEAWLDWIRSVSSKMKLIPTFVSQVRRDNSLADSLSKRVNGEAILFDGTTSHAIQEDLVRGIYRQARIAIGDRLHGLIVAASEGAVPLGWIESSSGKISRHFNAVDLTFVGRLEGASGAELPIVDDNDIGEWRESLALHTARARLRIEETQRLADEVVVRTDAHQSRPRPISS